MIRTDMSAPLGRHGLIGLAVGAAAGLGLMAVIVYTEIRRRRARRRVAEARGAAPLPLHGPREAAPTHETLETHAEAQMKRTHVSVAEAEAQQEAVAAVEAMVQALSPEQQLQLRNQLDQVLNCVASLRSEVAELRGGLQDIALQIIQDVKKGVEDSQRVRRRRHLIHRDRTDSTSSSSIYFTASQGVASAYEETSEGGYSTAYAESDYTDRDTDREGAEKEEESEKEAESEDEERSCATVLTLRQDDSQEEEDRGLDEDEDEEQCGGGRGLRPPSDVPGGELALLLAQSDVLHTGDARLKEEGFRLLLDNRAEYGDSRHFLWRLARAYSDMYHCTEDPQKKRTVAQQGQEEAELALKKNGLNAECHKWFAVLTGLRSTHESVHSKLKSSRILKEHLDRALALRDDDPMCFYLMGRWCYEVSTLGWLEQKAAAALYQTPPTSTLHNALDNFLKAEELSPGFSKMLRLYIAKCHVELGNISEATNWIQQALKTPSNAPQDEDSSPLEDQLQVLVSKHN